MAAPATLAEFFDLIRRSGVVDEGRLGAYLQAQGGENALPEEPARAAGILVRDGILTQFQAEQLLAGKWRRFTIGKYKVLERVGSGGMGSVYLCEHMFMRRRVAVKVLPTAKAEDQAALERFYREARAVAALDHPNLVRAYDIDQDEKLHFLVMEYIDGSSLQDIVKRNGPLDITRAVHYVRQTAVGLDHAHKVAGLVHRDIKPGNILLDRRGLIRILDLGLARFFHDDEGLPITQKFDENVLGTADYLAPEQALDSHNVDIRADIYSLGATFYFMLTGNTPFDGTVAQKLIWHQTRNPRPIREVRPEIPEEVAAIVAKMMAKDPAQRYSTPADLVEALKPLAPEIIAAPPEEEMPHLSPAALGPPSGPESAPPGPSASPIPSSRPSSIRPAAGFPRPSSAARAAAPISAVAAAPEAPPGGTSRQRREVAAPAALPAAAPAWESEAPETDDASARADTSPRSLRLPSLPLPGVPPHRRALVLAAAGGVVGAMLLALIVWSFRGGTEPEVPNSGPSVAAPRGPKNFTVTRVSRPDSYKTVREALYDAQPGDTITIADDEHEEDLIVNQRFGNEVSVVAGNPTHQVRWVCSAKPKYGTFVSLAGVSGLHFKGFIFDGKNRVKELIHLTGDLPHLVLEDVQFENAQVADVAAWNCSGANGGPVELRRARFRASKETESGISFNTLGNSNANSCRDITLSECRFEGPFQAAVRVTGSVHGVDIRSNRFYQATDGIRFDRAAPPIEAGMKIESNTFFDVRVGVDFQGVPQSSKSVVDVSYNLFAQVGQLARVEEKEAMAEAKALVNASGNACDASSREGNLPVQAAPLPRMTLPTDPADDGHFLRYPRNGPLGQLGTSGRPIGVPQPD